MQDSDKKRLFRRIEFSIYELERICEALREKRLLYSKCGDIINYNRINDIIDTIQQSIEKEGP